MQGRIAQAWSTDGGVSWGQLPQTSLLNANAGTDAVTLKNGTQLLVYNPALPGKEWYTGRGKLRVAESADGKAWHDAATLEDGTAEEYRLVPIIKKVEKNRPSC